MITRSSIAFEDFLGSSLAPQVMPPCMPLTTKMMVAKIVMIITTILKYYNDGADYYIDDDCAPTLVPALSDLSDLSDLSICNIQYTVYNIYIDDDLEPT